MRIINLLPALLLTTPALAMEQHMDAMPVAKLAVDHLEQRFDGDEQALAWELEATYGNDLHKAVLIMKSPMCRSCMHYIWMMVHSLGIPCY